MRAVDLWRGAAQRAAWDCWRQALHLQRVKKQQLGAAVALWQHAMLHGAWATWLAHCEFRRHARAVVLRFMHQSTARAFASWRAFCTWRAQLATRQAVAVQRWQSRALASAFSGALTCGRL